MDVRARTLGPWEAQINQKMPLYRIPLSRYLLTVRHSKQTVMECCTKPLPAAFAAHRGVLGPGDHGPLF
jgi:hypothetical protein